MFKSFWQWYERNYVLNVSIVLGLFLLQLGHLAWLGGDVIATRLLGEGLLNLEGIWQVIIILIDYTEIPAILTISLVYIDAWRRGERWHAIIMLALLHSQWLHMFWITDEFVVDTFTGAQEHGTVLPAWLAWVAILIDYLELPVILDTARRLFLAVKNKEGLLGIREALKEDE